MDFSALFPPAPSYFPGLLGEEQARLAQQQAQQQGLLGAALGLMQAGGPSRTPVSFGQSLAQGLQAGQQAYTGALQQRVQEQMVGAQLAEMQRKQRQQQTYETALTGGEGPFSELSSGQRAVAAVLGPEQGAKYLGEQLTPKYSTTPTTMMIGGRPTSVLFSSTGAMRIVDAQPMPNEEQINLGDRIAFRDKATGVISGSIPLMIGPAESQRLQNDAIRLGFEYQKLQNEAQRLGMEGYQLIETPSGYQYVPKAPVGAAQPVLGAGGAPVMGKGEKPTEGQSNAAAFLSMMREATSVLNKPITNKAGVPLVDAENRPITADIMYGSPGVFESLVASIPFAGEGMRPTVTSEDRQRVRQAQQAWVRAKLRKESAAAIGENEMDQEIKTFFPQVGDKYETIMQKALMRNQAENALLLQAGPAGALIPPLQPTAPMRPAQGRTQRSFMYNPTTGKIEEAQ